MATSHLSSPKAHIENIAIVGVGGRSGRSICDALLRTGKHRVTAITRSDSSSTMPSGLHAIVKVDYTDHTALVNALTREDALIITMAVTAPPTSQIALIDAAVEAGVRYIMPNEWGVDLTKTEMSNDTMMNNRYMPVREHIEKFGAGKTSWIGLCCGFWYEFSLAGTEARYGFDFARRTLTIYGRGDVKINTSTWPLVGMAVAKLFSWRIESDGKDAGSPCLSAYANKAVYVSSFFVSQRDMFQSVLRVTGDSENDWTITQEDVVARYHRGMNMMKEGQIVGFGILLYARVFYEDGAGDYNGKLDNEVLELPEESLDEATRVAVKMALAGETNSIH